MSQKSIFQKNGITTTEDLFNFCTKLDYGWVEKNGTKHAGVNDSRKYSLQSPEELLKSQIGICWDQTELHRAFLEQEGYHPKTFFFYYYLSDDNCPSHSITTYQKDGKFFWFEPMFKKDQTTHGIHTYNSESELLKSSLKKWTAYAIKQGILPEKIDPTKYSLYKYDKPKYGINDEDFYNHCRAGVKIDII